ncbi:MAG: NADH:ubiquinone reductase (Na(+)-transporting) subunit D [Kiritimatiellae bacterium]|nr:NADH:ubiquinone reductase (Na(+)-transporting) subunit D [Kiritimatiellia bacterium]
MASAKKIIKDPLFDNNPITWQMLGICSALAVTTQVNTAMVMSVALTFVLVLSNMTISALRTLIPTKIRMIVELCVIATLVIIADQVLKAFMYDISKQLSVFVGLIITNCIVMGRAEAFALQNNVRDSMLDGLGNALGYSIILVAVAAIREWLGSGTLLGIQAMPASYSGNLLMVLPPGAFIIIALLIWAQRTFISKTLREDN